MILILVAILSRKDEDFFFFTSVSVIGHLYSDHRVDSLGKTASFSIALLHLLKFGNPVYLLIVTSAVQKQYYDHSNPHRNYCLVRRK